MTEQDDLRAKLDEVFSVRERSNMAPTIAKFLKLSEEHPDNAQVLYELGGAYDTDGQEETALGYYRRAIELGLQGKWLRQCYLQMGSTLRNLEKFDESLSTFDLGLSNFPESTSLKIFRALTLHAMGKVNASLGSVFEFLASNLHDEEIQRYKAALLGNSAYLKELDQ